MIICDMCKNLKVKTFEIQLRVIKFEELKTRQKLSDRVIITIPAHFCDGCLTKFNSRLGKLVADIRGEPPSIEIPVPQDEELINAVRNKGKLNDIRTVDS